MKSISFRAPQNVKRFVAVILLFLILPLFCFTQEKGNINDFVKKDLFRGEITTLNEPKVNNQITIRLKLNPIDNFDNIKIRISLYKGVTLISGIKIQDYFAQKDIEYYVQYIVQIDAVGFHQIKFVVFDETNPGLRNSYFLSFLSSEGSGSILKDKEEIKKIKGGEIPSYQQSPSYEDLDKQNEILPQVIDKSQIKLNNESKGINGIVSISGRLRYEDIISGSLLPVRYATVKIFRYGGLWDTEIGSGYTDNTGNFNISISCTGTENISVKIYNESSAAKCKTGILGNLYEVRLPTSTNTYYVIDCSNSTYSIGTSAYMADNNPNWQAVDNAITEYKWIADRTSNWTRSRITIYYPQGDWPGYRPKPLDYIELCDMAFNDWDNITVFHEYAHAVMGDIYSIDLFEECNLDPHYLWSETCEQFAITEGWAEFLSSAIVNDPNIISGGTPVCVWTLPNNLEKNIWWKGESCTNANGAIVEGSVASIFWDIFDSPGSDDDGLQFGFNNSSGSIWQIILDHQPKGINAFWDQWMNHYQYKQELWSIFFSQSINKDNTPPTNPTSITSTSHTISTWSADRTIDMTWSGSTDDLSGTGGYSWVFDVSPTTIPDQTVDGTATSATSSSLGDGTSWYFHLRGKDNAGNWNSSAVHRGPYFIDGSLPVGTIRINNGAASTCLNIVTLSLYAIDDVSGVTQMQFSNNGTSWSPWEAYSTSKNWDLLSYGGIYSVGNKVVYARYRDLSGNISSISNDDIQFNPIPSQPGEISGPISPCSNSSNNVYSVTNVSGITYTWSYSGASTTITSGQGTNSIVVSYSPSATSGTWIVIPSNSCGYGTSRTKPITISSVPGQPGPIVGTSTVCQGSTGIAYSIDAVPNATHYIWKYTGNGISFNNSSANDINIDFAANATSGNLAVQGTNSCGNGSLSQNYPITVNVRPVPFFTVSPGGTSNINTDVTYTTQSDMMNYEWTLSGTLNVDYTFISGGIGATSNTTTLRWLSTGSKTVTVNYSNSNGCTGLSPASSTTAVVNASTLIITPSYQDVTYLAGTTSFTVASNIEWTVSCNQTWCTVTPSGTGNGTISVIYEANTDPNSRIATITVSGSGVSNQIITVTQSSTGFNLPDLSTVAISKITKISAISGGEIASDGGATITAKGVCWSTGPGPTVDLDTKTVDGTGINSFASRITELSPGTTYYVRAYATNSDGTGYGGNEISFTTYNSDAITDVDTNYYNLITIGSQKWLTKNLSSTKFNDNSPIPNITDNTIWANLSTPGYCWFNNDIIFKNTFGALYNWYTASTGNLCPIGLHVPSDEEWKTLEMYLGMTQAEADATGSRGTQAFQLKSATGWKSSGNGSNTSGFTALPGGYRVENGLFYNICFYGTWWSSTESSISTKAWPRFMYYFTNAVDRSNNNKQDGFSVRCVLNTLPTVSTNEITSISQISALGGGNVTSEGISPVTARGICWSYSPNPTLELAQKTNDGTGSGTFTSIIKGFLFGKTYYVRAYATNSNGTGYGNEVSFKYEPKLLAYYPLFSDSKDVTGKNSDMILINCPFSKGGIYCNGIYNLDYPEGSNAHTPTIGQISYDSLTIYTEFMVDEYSSFYNPVIVAGAGWYDRWLGFAILSNGQYSLRGDNFVEVASGSTICTLNVWHSATIAYNSTTTSGKLFIDGALVCEGNFTFDRQYAHKSIGMINYSNATSFKGYLRNVKIYNDIHDPRLPIVEPSASFSNTPTTGISGGIVTSEGISPVVARGVCWSTSQGPTTDLNTKTTDGSGIGDFISNITGLTPGTIYYIRTYATNSIGTSYGSEINFKTYNSNAVQDIEGNYYNIVTIGSQIWMAENLKTIKYNDGTSILLVTDQSEWKNLTQPGYCWYNNNEASYKGTYGALYNWYAATAKNLCPVGWHVPTYDEWWILVSRYGGEAYAGRYLKESGIDHWLSPNSGNNESGFTALPGGSRRSYGTDGFNGIQREGAWWGSTGNSYAPSIYWYMSYAANYGSWEGNSKTTGYSIRCLKDETSGQYLSLTNGWNLISFAVQPSNMSLRTIVDPLVGAGTLVKVQDEKGRALERLSDPIGWINEIGQMSVTEGYKIRVTGNTSLSLTGNPVTLPLNIPLDAGWNIIGYPVMSSQSSSTAFSSLITAGTLLKAQNEQGSAIEQINGTWTYGFQNLNPGEGYKVKTNAATTVTISSAGKGEIVYEEKSITKPIHFKPAYIGNGLDHMNIYLDSPTADGTPLRRGDEIGIFDDGICVGASVVEGTENRYMQVIVSLDDPITEMKDGFTEGNMFELKLWNSETGMERKTLNIETAKGYNKTYEKLGTTVIKVDFEGVPESFLGDAYPNPSTDRTMFTFQLAAEGRVRLEIYNVMGNLVRILVNETMSGGIHEIRWDNQTGSGNKAKAGIYFYRLRLNDLSQVKQFVIH